MESRVNFKKNNYHVNSLNQNFGNLNLDEINHNDIDYFRNNHIHEICSILENDMKPIKTIVVQVQVDSTVLEMEADTGPVHQCVQSRIMRSILKEKR